MKIVHILKNRYIIIYLLVYLTCIMFASVNGINISEILMSAIIIGVVFTSISYFLSKSAIPVFKEPASQKNEIALIIPLIVYFALYITFFHKLLFLDAQVWIEKDQLKAIIKGLSKFLFLVIIPLYLYFLIYGFKLKHWGINLKLNSVFTKQSLIIFFAFLLIMFFFQYYLGNGARPLREGLYSYKQILIAIIPYFFWLCISVGIVEEFVFRAFLQSRLSIVLKSEIGGIIISAIIFGLAHAPGMYLRGGGMLSNLGSTPGLFQSIIYCFLILSVAGFFLSVIWMKTKNFWLIVGVHASVDLISGLANFIDLWKI